MKCALSLLLTAVLIGLVASDTPTLYPASPFDPYADSKKVFKAIDGFGTDEAAIISVLCHRVGVQRAQIATTYVNQYGKSLIHDLDGDLSGNFNDLCDSLTYLVTEYLAIELKRIFDKKTSLDARSVNEVLISRSNLEISNINLAFLNRFQKPLKSVIESTYAGSVKQLLSQLSNGVRADNSSPVDQSVVNKDVVDLYNAGQGMAGTNENVFINIFTARSYNHLKVIFSAYASQYGTTMETVILSEFNGDIATLLLDIIQYTRNKATYLAQQLFLTMDGAGTRDHSLIRLIISRCEIDLGDVKAEYQRIYGRTLATDVSGDCSGDYKRALLALIN